MGLMCMLCHVLFLPGHRARATCLRLRPWRIRELLVRQQLVLATVEIRKITSMAVVLARKTPAIAETRVVAAMARVEETDVKSDSLIRRLCASA